MRELKGRQDKMIKSLLGALIIASVFGCTDGTPRNSFPETHPEVPMKYCIDACKNEEFSRFHHGESFGGSSSMGGLHQEAIYDRVEKSCKEFYGGEKCCELSFYKDYKDRYLRPVHGYEYAPCSARK